MSKSTCTLIVSLAFTASLFCLSAVANTLPVPTPTTTGTPEITFDCKFDGGASDKSGSWYKRCHAEGTLTPLLPGRTPQDEGTLKVICDDGDDDQDNHDHPLFDGAASSRFDRDDQTLIIKGVKERNDDRRTPVITVFDIEQKDLCPAPGGRENERRYSSQIEFDQDGNDFILTGRCEFKCAAPVALN